MAIQANNPLARKGKKKNLSKKKDGDLFLKKSWYNLLAPTFFQSKVVGKTVIQKISTKNVTEKKLVGRTFEVFQKDLNDGDHFRKFRFMVTDVTGTECHSEFQGMEITSDVKIGMVKKWHSLINGIFDFTTQEGFTMRLQMAATTRKEKDSLKKTCYATKNQIKDVRKLMEKTVESKMNNKSISEIVKVLCDDEISKIISSASDISIGNCHVTKVKIVKRPIISN